jgi:hypothetical protein
LDKLWYCCGLVAVAVLSSGITAVLVGPRQAARAAPALALRPEPVLVHAVPANVQVLLALVRAKHAVIHKRAKPVVKAHVARRSRKSVAATHITHGPTVTPSLYERTTSTLIVRGQGCHAGEARTNGLVVLDFGKLAYRTRRGGYGTITFADHFASNTAIGWAAKSYARGYSECLPKGSAAHITLAIGTSNYNQDVPSTTVAGKLWAKQTSSLGAYLENHRFDHVTAAAGDDVEPAWDRGFLRTYGFFSGFGSAHPGYLIYNYGSLDGGVESGIWKLRQAYYVSGGMKAARAVPEIYNRTMAKEWAELAQLAMHRYGKPIKLAGLMTQHSSKCRGCGYTAAQAHSALVEELAKHPETRVRTLAAATNIGASAPVTAADLRQP